MANRNKQKNTTKKHLARVQKEKKQIRTITYTTIIIISIVIVLLFFGIAGQTLFQSNQPVAEVGGESITTKSYQAHVRLLRQQLINQYIQYLQFAQMFGMDPATDPTIASGLQQIQNQLGDTASLGEGVLNQMIDNILIRQEAIRMGISISEDEVESIIRENLGYTPNGTPIPKASPSAVTYPTLNPTQLVLYPPSATPEILASLTVEASATLEPTMTQVTSITATSVPTITPYTLEGYENQYSEMVTSYEAFGMSETAVRMLFQDSLYYDSVFPIITKDVPRSAEMVWVRHILVSESPTAMIVRKELLDDGSWDLLAQEYSTDPGSSSNGGDLGWFQHGTMVAEFEYEAFRLDIGEISLPIETTYGFHIIQVLGHEDRPLSSDEFQVKATEAFSIWVASLRESTEITIYDYYKDRIPVDPTLQDALGQ